MTDSTDLALLGSATYAARVTPLRSGGRRDIEVTPADPDLPAAFGQTDIVASLRQFFLALDEEAQRHRGDPVAQAQALARLEALLADVRSVRDSVRDMTAAALSAERVRRLTVSGVVTVEASSETRRTEWSHAELLAAVLQSRLVTLVDHGTGALLEPDEAAALLLEYLRPDWRLSAVRELGIDPDDYCQVARDDDGRPMREPAVRIVDNSVRRIGGAA